MSIFPDWHQYAVPQRHHQTGCIPTGYEILLRAAHVPGIDFSSFQEDFDLDRPFTGNCRNNFESVAAAIQARYPHVRLASQSFQTGAEKLSFLEGRLAQKAPVLVSIANGPSGGWHIMPVVDLRENTVILLEGMNPNGEPHLRILPSEEMARIHDQWPGGKDVAFVAGFDQTKAE